MMNSRAMGNKERYRWLPGIIVAITIIIFGIANLWITFEFRRGLRQQMLQREADVLDGAATLLVGSEIEGVPELAMDDSAVQMNVILKVSRLRGVLAARLFDGRGKFVVAFPSAVVPAGLNESDLATMIRLRPLARFYREAHLDRLLWRGGHPEAKFEGQTAPLVEVLLPLRSANQTALLGIAQLIMDGRSLAEEYAALDRRLAVQSGSVFLAGSLLIVCGLAWAFQRLRRVNKQLREYSELLRRANEELALAAKTAGVGAVAAHLVHGIKNPLTGLYNLLSSLSGDPEVNERALQLAVESTDALRRQINEIVRLLRGEGAWDKAEVKLSEIIQRLEQRMAPLAHGTGVNFCIEFKTDAVLNNRDASLVLLILENLVRNAIEATPCGHEVRLGVLSGAEDVYCEVRDQGAGFPPEQRAAPFSPCQSGKAGGAGIGLAISKQLSDYIGMKLTLVATGDSGSTLELRLPQSVARKCHPWESSCPN